MAHPGQTVPRDKNYVSALVATDSTDPTKTVAVTADVATGRLLVSSSGGAAGTQYAEGATTTPGTGTLAIGRYMASPPSLADGAMNALQIDSSGALKITGSISVGGTTDNSAYTAGTSTGTTAFGFYHSTIDSVTDGRSAAIAIDAKRNQLMVLRDAAGNARGLNIDANNALAATVTNATATNLKAEVVGTGTFVTQSTLAAETTKVIGVVRNADGSGNLLTSTSNALDINIKSGSIGNTAFIANAGTNLNTSALALESGGNLATVAGAIISQEATTSGVKGVTVFGAVTTASPSYTTAKSDALSLDPAGNLRVSLKDTPANTNKLLVTPDSVALPANQSVNVSQINGVTPLMGTGVMGTGSPRVTIASDNDPLIVKQATAGNLNATVVGTGAFVTQSTLAAETTKVIGVVRNSDGAGNLLTSNSTTYTAKFGLDSNLLGTLGTAFSTAGKVDIKGADGDVFVRQTTGTNLHVVADSGSTTAVTGTVAVTESGTWNVGSSSATGAAVPANGFYSAALAKTSLPAAASDGNLTGNMADKFGRQVVLPNAIRDLVGSQTTTITASTSETTIITAGGAGIFLDLVSIFISNTSATPARVDIRDATAGSIIFQLYIPAGDMRGISLNVPWPQTSANGNWTAQSSASVTDLRVSAHYIKNK